MKIKTLFNMLQKIHVNHYEINDKGLIIAYTYEGQRYWLPFPPEEVEQVLASVGNTLEDGISQYDAILIAAEHEKEKKLNKPYRFSSDSLFEQMAQITK